MNGMALGLGLDGYFPTHFAKNGKCQIYALMKPILSKILNIWRPLFTLQFSSVVRF